MMKKWISVTAKRHRHRDTSRDCARVQSNETKENVHFAELFSNAETREAIELEETFSKSCGSESVASSSTIVNIRVSLHLCLRLTDSGSQSRSRRRRSSHGGIGIAIGIGRSLNTRLGGRITRRSKRTLRTVVQLGTVISLVHGTLKSSNTALYDRRPITWLTAVQ